MTRRKPDEFAQAIYGDSGQAPRNRRQMWRRAGLPITVAIAIVVATAVITDLPTREPLSSEQAAGAALLTEVNNDVSPCAFSLEEADTIYREVRAGTLSASNRARVPSLLQDDAAACSFTSDNVNDLADIEEPGTGAGKYLSQVVSLAQTWTTSDALGALDDIIALEADRHDAMAAQDLATRQRYLTSDRRAALAALTSADRYLHDSLPTLVTPAVALPSVPIP